MTTPAKFPMDGPHSPDTVREAADLIAEGVRYLNLATKEGQGGLQYPGDVYDLLGALSTATGRIPQLLAQLAAFMRSQSGLPGLADSNHPDAALWAHVCANDLDETARMLEGVTWNLGRRQSDLSGMSIREDDDGTD